MIGNINSFFEESLHINYTPEVGKDGIAMEPSLKSGTKAAPGVRWKCIYERVLTEAQSDGPSLPAIGQQATFFYGFSP